MAGALAAAAFLATGCSAGPGPLTGDNGSGTQCFPSLPGKPVTQGFYDLDNTGSTAVKVDSVRLPPDAKGLAMTRQVWLVPEWRKPGGASLFMGLGAVFWPPQQGAFTFATGRWPTWRWRQPAVGGTIRPHQDLNLVYGLTRTTSKPGTASGPVVTYTAGGSRYTLAETFGQELAKVCK